MKLSADSVAGCTVRVLKARGVERVFASCGGHIMPIWMRPRRGRHPHHRRARRARRRAHGAGAGRADRRARRRAGNRRPRRDQCDDRHRQRARLARTRAGAIRKHRPARRKTAAVCRISTTRFCCVASRATPAPCASLRWCCRSSTKRSHGPLAKAGSLDRPTSTFRPIRCAAEMPKALQLAEHIDAKAARRHRPDPTRSIGLWMLLWSAKRVLVIFRAGRQRRRTGAGSAARQARCRLPRHR